MKVNRTARLDYSVYRERLRKSYVETEPPQNTDSELQERKSLWTNTYNDSPSLDARKLAEENSISELQEKANYWSSQYHRALRAGKREEADEAYTKYKGYKEALEVKEAFNWLSDFRQAIPSEQSDCLLLSRFITSAG